MKTKMCILTSEETFKGQDSYHIVSLEEEKQKKICHIIK